MKKFNFAYATLLRYREMQEELAKKDLFEAQKKVESEETTLKKLYDRQDQAREMSLNFRKKGGMVLGQLQLIEEYLVGEKKKTLHQRDVIRGLKQIAEEKQHHLVEVARDKKVIEKLKEKAFDQFKQDVNKQEVKEADDITSTRFKRGVG